MPTHEPVISPHMTNAGTAEPDSAPTLAFPTPSRAGRGWQGQVLRLLGATDIELTVTGTERVTDHFLRVHVTDGGLLATHGYHPTMWLRLWFPIPGTDRLHQRGYTVVDPRPGAFTLEFALHDGPATAWACQATPGTNIAATLKGSRFALPTPAPDHWLIVGDSASLPAINSLLDALPAATPVRLILETQHDTDAAVPLRLTSATEVTRHRRGVGTSIVDAVLAAPLTPASHAWIACEARTTRETVKALRVRRGLGRERITSQAYWKE